MAEEIFKIHNQDILNAIGCHTTLKKDATTLDKIVFIADKIKWDQNYNAPFHNELLDSIKISLDEACYCYLKYLWNQKESLAVIHPWME
jgi:HD superfamily phosphohydrolase YqeK